MNSYVRLLESVVLIWDTECEAPRCIVWAWQRRPPLETIQATNSSNPPLFSLSVAGSQQEIVIPADLPLVQELGATLREWAQIWHKLFVVGVGPGRPGPPTRLPITRDLSTFRQENRTPLFRGVQQMAYSLIEYRSQIVSGTLPKDDLVELKKKVTAKIDYGNRWGRRALRRSRCVCAAA